MNLTERERSILQLAKQGLSDYRIARKMSMDPPPVTRSHKNAQRKLLKSVIDLEWATRIGVSLESELIINGSASAYSFFL